MDKFKTTSEDVLEYSDEELQGARDELLTKIGQKTQEYFDAPDDSLEKESLRKECRKLCDVIQRCGGPLWDECPLAIKRGLSVILEEEVG